MAVVKRHATYKEVEVCRLVGERWVVASTHGGNDPIVAGPFGPLPLEPAPDTR